MVMEELKILINSAFNNQGFKAFEKQLKSLKMESFTPQLAKLSPSTLSGMFPDMKKILDQDIFGKNLKFDVFKGAPKQAMASAKAMSLAFRNGFKSPIEQYMPEIQKSLDNLFPEPKKKMTTFDNVVKKTIKQMDSEIGKIKPVELKSAFKDLGGFADLTGFSKQNKDIIVQNAWLKRFGVQIDQTTGSYMQLKNGAEATTEQMANIKKASPQFMAFSKNVERSGHQMKKLGLEAENEVGRFKMYYLSVMFFGMQLQRTFGRMATQSMQSFMKINEGSSEAGQGMMVLNAAMETMKYTLGEAIAQALLPFIPAIIDIITWIVDLIDKTGALIPGIVLFGLALGGAMFFIGQFGLGISGIITFLKELGLIKTVDKIASIGTTAKTATSGVSGLEKALRGLALVAGLVLTIGGITKIVSGIKEGDVEKAVKGSVETALGMGVLAGTAARTFGASFGVSAVAAGLVFAIVGDLLILITGHVAYKQSMTNLGVTADEMLQAAKNLIQDKIDAGELSATTDITLAATKRVKNPFIQYDKDLMEEALALNERNKQLDDYASQVNEAKKIFGSEDNIFKSRYFELVKRSLEYKNLADQGFGFEDIKTKSPEIISAINDILDTIPKENLPFVRGFGISEVVDTFIADLSKVNEPAKSFNDLIRENAGTMTEFITATDDTKIKSLGDALETFVKRIDKMNLSSLWMLSGAITTISDTLSGGGNIANGLLQATQKVGEAIAGKGGLQEKAQGFSDLLVETFIGNVQASVNVLDKDAKAANDAASAQERYNRAKQGATGA